MISSWCFSFSILLLIKIFTLNWTILFHPSFSSFNRLKFAQLNKCCRLFFVLFSMRFSLLFNLFIYISSSYQMVVLISFLNSKRKSTWWWIREWNKNKFWFKTKKEHFFFGALIIIFFVFFLFCSEACYN